MCLVRKGRCFPFFGLWWGGGGGGGGGREAMQEKRAAVTSEPSQCLTLQKTHAHVCREGRLQDLLDYILLANQPAGSSTHFFAIFVSLY
jgi:hypothetical protein